MVVRENLCDMALENNQSPPSARCAAGGAISPKCRTPLYMWRLLLPYTCKKARNYSKEKLLDGICHLADHFPILLLLRMMTMQRHIGLATVLGFFI